MPRYFFNVRSDGSLVEDPEGTELADEISAEMEALEVAREIIIERIRARKPVLSGSVVVRDKSGRLVVTTPFVSVLADGQLQPAR